MKTAVYNLQGEKVSDYELDESLFNLRWNADLVHQVAMAMQANRRKTVAHAKGRGEVRGGGKKPWRQKGTGRSRHGSIRSPIWRGGGVAHGPTKHKRYDQKINKKMKTKALFTVLSRKWRDGDMLLVNDFSLPAPRTKTAASLLANLARATDRKTLAYERGRRALLALPADDPVAAKSFRNLAAVGLTTAAKLNPLDLLTYRHLVVVDPEKTFSILAGRRR